MTDEELMLIQLQIKRMDDARDSRLSTALFEHFFSEVKWVIMVCLDQFIPKSNDPMVNPWGSQFRPYPDNDLAKRYYTDGEFHMKVNLLAAELYRMLKARDGRKDELEKWNKQYEEKMAP